MSVIVRETGLNRRTVRRRHEWGAVGEPTAGALVEAITQGGDDVSGYVPW